MEGDVVPTHSQADLRGKSISHKRQVEYKSKWHPKWTQGSVYPNVHVDSNGTERPCTSVVSQNAKRCDRRVNSKYLRRTHVARKQELANDHDDPKLADLDTTDEGSNTSTSPRTEEDTVYPFEVHGEVVLDAAVTQAVTKFEDKKTRELVRDEYDVLDEASDTETEGFRSKGSVDDDFELL